MDTTISPAPDATEIALRRKRRELLRTLENAEELQRKVVLFVAAMFVQHVRTPRVINEDPD